MTSKSFFAATLPSRGRRRNPLNNEGKCVTKIYIPLAARARDWGAGVLRHNASNDESLTKAEASEKVEEMKALLGK
jgi:hypothetical protein